eukprot:gnl/Trimastix_PCT/1348.p2 GENE.gnl/Trimastix_PCT/1348~~gnl/Trimastix_PCT/1348.p2  ORF type:complete len:283 (+),score=53.54 gnl/Trimastix_PCT/1348:114-962(+)
MKARVPHTSIQIDRLVEAYRHHMKVYPNGEYVIRKLPSATILNLRNHGLNERQIRHWFGNTTKRWRRYFMAGRPELKKKSTTQMLARINEHYESSLSSLRGAKQALNSQEMPAKPAPQLLPTPAADSVEVVEAMACVDTTISPNSALDPHDNFEVGLFGATNMCSDGIPNPSRLLGVPYDIEYDMHPVSESPSASSFGALGQPAAPFTPALNEDPSFGYEQGEVDMPFFGFEPAPPQAEEPLFAPLPGDTLGVPDSMGHSFFDMYAAPPPFDFPNETMQFPG